MTRNDITPFIQSVGNVFQTMLSLSVSIDTPTCRTGPSRGHDISAVIGLTGDLVGSVVLCFSNETARGVVAKLCQTEELTDALICDAVGELVNMIAGSAKAMMEGRKTSISCPSIITGAGHAVTGMHDRPVIVIPCSTECGDFTLELIFEIADTATRAA